MRISDWSSDVCSSDLLDERQCGHIWVKGSSVMSGYFQDPESTAEVMVDGWLNTGDIGYRVGARLMVTARHKDVIIITGPNTWPQDLTHLADRVEGVVSSPCWRLARPGPTGTEKIGKRR